MMLDFTRFMMQWVPLKFYQEVRVSETLCQLKAFWILCSFLFLFGSSLRAFDNEEIRVSVILCQLGAFLILCLNSFSMWLKFRYF